MADDPFPRARIGTLLRRAPAYLRLGWALGREPMLSRARRAALIAAAGYLVSPVDLVPGVIPVVGQLDDLAVVIAAIRFALAGLSPDQRRRHLEAVGLEDAHLLEDVRTLGVATAWLARAGARTTTRTARRTAAVTAAGARVTIRTTRILAGAASTAAAIAGPPVRSAAAVAGPAARGATARGLPLLGRTASASATTLRSAARVPGRLRPGASPDGGE